jgi:hypothetical protein
LGSLLGCSLAAILLASSGTGTQAVETTIQDDAILLHRSDAEVVHAVKQIRELGVDRVRLTAGWSALAPGPRREAKPKAPFDPTDSSTYPQAGFAALDRAIRVSAGWNLKVQLDLAFWAPRWAVKQRGENPDRERFIPNPKEFGAFATAIARRYSGHFTDSRHGIVLPLPRVDIYTTWNEPNKATFLAPQWIKKRSGHGYRPYSPHIYRPMHEQAYAAVKAVDPTARVLIGALNSRGSRVPGLRGVAPLAFLRTLACVGRNLKPLRVPECNGTGKLHADGLSLHPYSMHVAPGTSAEYRDDIFLADLGRADTLIAQLLQLGRIDGQWPLYITEYGYETKPPDPTARFTPAQQAQHLGWATFLAQSDPSVRMFAQFLLRDLDLTKPHPGESLRRNDFQTGLLFANGQPKPSASAFKLPLFVSYATTPAGDPGLIFYGGVRPGAESRIVRVERRAPGTDAWVPVHTSGATCGDDVYNFVTERTGFFRRIGAWEGPGDYRLGWLHGTGYEYGAPITVTAKPLVAIAPPAGR